MPAMQNYAISPPELQTPQGLATSSSMFLRGPEPTSLPLKWQLCEFRAEVCSYASRPKAIIKDRLHDDVITFNIVIY